MLSIWGRTNSINVMKVLWTCAEVDVHYQRIDAGMQHGQVGEPHFLQMNPNGRVPVLNDDGFILWESNAIVRYLCYKYSLGSLYPTDMRHRALAEQWMDWQQTTISPPLAWPFHGLVRDNPAYRNEFKLAQAAEELNRLFGMLDLHLQANAYVLGPRFTMADIPLGATAWRWFNLPVQRTEVPHVQRWFEQLQQRDGYRQHIMQPLS